MANVKRLILDYSATALTVYAIIRREVDSYRLDDATGNFAASPADPYVTLTEDAVIKGRYEKNESRQVWNDGRYTVTVYQQTGGSPAPVSDTIIGSEEMWISADAEVAVDISVSTRLATSGYTAPDNTSIVAIKAKTDTIVWQNITDLHDEAMGKWVLDPTAKTLTLYRADSVSVLKTFSLTDTSASVPSFIQRIPV